MKIINQHVSVRQVCSIFFATAIIIFSSCDKDAGDDKQYEQIRPTKPKPEWGPTITPQMQAVIETLDTISPIPLYTLTPQEARQKPTPADAVMRVMKNYNIPAPPMKVDTIGKEIPVDKGSIHVRVYTPKTGKNIYPVIVYYHGGGWVIATIDTYHASAQALAEKADAIVISVEYRKGPEYKFPTAHNDAYAAYLWALKNAASLHGDSTKLAVAGESAGGNLAISVSMRARDGAVRLPLHQLAVYPIANNDLNSPSYIQYAAAKPLNKPFMQWFFTHYLNNPAEGDSPWISLVEADLRKLPPTTIIAAEIDPLQSEGKMLADKLTASGVAVTYKLYAGVVHEFFGMATVVPEAVNAQSLAVNELKKSIGK